MENNKDGKFTSQDGDHELTIWTSNISDCISVEMTILLPDEDESAKAVVRLYPWEVKELVGYLNKLLKTPSTP